LTYIAANAAFQVFNVGGSGPIPLQSTGRMVAIIVGTALGWTAGYMQPGR